MFLGKGSEPLSTWSKRGCISLSTVAQSAAFEGSPQASLMVGKGGGRDIEHAWSDPDLGDESDQHPMSNGIETMNVSATAIRIVSTTFTGDAGSA